MYKSFFSACLLSAAMLAPSLAEAGSARLVRDGRAYEISLKGQGAGIGAGTIRASANYSATTVGGLTWTRPFADCTGATGLGPMTFHSQEFSVDTAGAHDISSVQDGGWDGYIFVYQGSFDPTAPNTNCVIGNDDGAGGIGTSDILGVNLTAGTAYFLVTTAFENGEEGTFTNTISGPGNIIIGGGPSADLSIVKTAPDGVAVGGSYTYVLAASNGGALDATGVVVTDVLPASVNFVTSTCGAVNNAGTITWTIGALANGASQSCTLTVSLDSPVCIAVSNTATISGNEADGIPSNNTSTASNGGSPGGNAVADPGFESYTPNPAWTEASTNFGTPLCTVGDCGTGNGTGPRTGSVWAWFGGIAAPETGSIQQSVVIPTGATAITFWREFPVCANGTDFIRLLIDGAEVWREDGTSAACNSVGYQQISVALSPGQANGAAHLVRFESTISGAPSGSNFFIDDVAINAPPTPPICTVGATGNLTIAPTAVDFGSIAIGASSTAQTVTLGNNGAGALQVTTLTPASAPFALTGGSCGPVPINLAPGGNCTLEYTFTPVVAGTANQSLTVTSSGTGSGTIDLTGTGGAGVLAVLSPSVAFGSQTVGSTTQRTLTISNTGTGPLQVTSLTAATAPFAQVAGGTCGPLPFTLAAGTSCTIFFSYSPVAGVASNQLITIGSDVGDVTATLSGLGIVPVALPALGLGSNLLLLLLLGFGSLVAIRRMH